MSKYSTPGVYTEGVNNVSPSIESVGASTGGFVGVSVRGKLNTPILVTSWQSFLDSFAYGMETPFIANSDLAYSVYGFFQNGGSRCYVIRTAGSTAKKAEATVGSALFTAKDEGEWGNKLSVAVSLNKDDNTKLDVTVMYDTEVVETFVVSTETTKEDYFVDVLEKSKFVSYISGELTVVGDAVSLSGGNDGLITDDSEVAIADSDYTGALEFFDAVEDVNLICIPGQTSDVCTKALLSYAENRGNVFAIVDGPKSADVSAIKEFRKGLSCKNGALYYPWIKVSDPLSKTGKLRDCPTCGHIMGVYARTIQERGVWKAPAGTECTIRGAVEVVKLLSKADTDILNPLGVNAVVPKSNYGIVVWGARSLNPDSSMRYVSDILLNTNISESVKQGTQWAVFEPNNNVLWLKAQTVIEAFLDSLWREGGLKGASASEAYFVKCDEELNPESSTNEGNLIIELGYAPNKPAEFVIIRIAHSISND